MSFELVATGSVTPGDPSGPSGNSAKRRRGEETQNKLPSLEDFDDVPKGVIMDLLIPDFKNMSCESQRRACIQMDPEHRLFSNGMCNDGHFKQLHESTCESEAVDNIFYEELQKKTVPFSNMSFLKTKLDKMKDKGVKIIDLEGWDMGGRDILNQEVLFSAKYAEEFILNGHDVDPNLFYGMSKRLPKLKKLRLHRPTTTIIMKEGTVFKNLTELQVTGDAQDTRFEQQKTVDPTFLKRLAVIFPNLEVVLLQDLANNKLLDGVRMLPNKKLKQLKFGQPMEACGYDLRFLKKFQNLRYIEITSHPTKFPDVEGLASLETLIVGHTLELMYPYYEFRQTFWESGEGSETTMSVNRSMKSLTNLKTVTIHFPKVLRFDDNDSPFPDGLKSLSLISVSEYIPDEVLANWDTSTCEVHLPARLPDALTKFEINTEFPGNILPDQIASLPNVEELTLYALKGFPSGVGGDGMKKLKKLTVQNAFEPLDLRHLIKLEELTISNYCAGVLPRLEGLSSLKKIKLLQTDSNTKIEVPVYFSDLTNLESFSLTTMGEGNNEITVNRNIDFSKLKKLKNITLNHGIDGKIFIFTNILSLPEDAEVRGVSKQMIPKWMKKLYKQRSKQLFLHLD